MNVRLYWGNDSLCVVSFTLITSLADITTFIWTTILAITKLLLKLWLLTLHRICLLIIVLTNTFYVPFFINFTKKIYCTTYIKYNFFYCSYFLFMFFFIYESYNFHDKLYTLKKKLFLAPKNRKWYALNFKWVFFIYIFLNAMLLFFCMYTSALYSCLI